MQVIGGIICLLVVVRLAMSITGSFRQRALAQVRSEKALSLLDEQIVATRALRVRREQQQSHWTGYRKFRLARKEEEADSTVSFYLIPHDGKPLPGYLPGQYLTFRFQVPGQKGPVVRCYSLSDSPCDEHYRITVKRVPSGLISNYLHDSVQEGDIIDVQAPRGDFALDPAGTSPVVLIGGGVGVTPVLSMANAIIQAGSSRDVWFFYGVRSGRDHAMKAHLRRLNEQYENFHLHVCYSSPAESDQPGTDYNTSGHVSADVIREQVKVCNFDFYVCGPPPMMSTLLPALEQWGVAKNRIHSEAFGPAAATKKPAAGKPVAPPSAKTVTVQFSRSGAKVAWSGNCQSLLDLAVENGVSIDSGCRAGSCGSCEVAVKQGKVSYNIEPGAECAEGSCLTCVSVPDSDLVLDA